VNKKIAIFSPFLNPVGVKKATFGLAKEFSKKNYLVEMLSVHKEWEGLKLVTNMKLIKLSKVFNSLPTEGFFIFRIISALVALRTLFTLSSYIRTNKPNILFVSMMPTLAFISLLISGQKSKVKLIISIQGYPRDNFIRSILWKIVFNRVDMVITESENLKQKIKEMTGISKNLKSIYNPHFEKQDEIVPDLDFKKPIFKYILGIGRLTQQKNFSLLLNSFNIIDEFSELNLIIIGDGEQRKFLERMSKKLNISERVHFLGNIANPLGYINEAEMLVISSLWEGLPRVAIEAQALKTPIISACTDGGLGEILMDGSAGILSKENDVYELKKSIEKYLIDKELSEFHAEHGFNNIDRFSLKNSAKEYLKELERY
jgi:glycosyltransferase involved in cell wall biosynthesis